jgi:hypothetical protein
MITFQQARKYFEARLGPLAHRAEVSLRCPFHDDSNPSFSVNVDKGAWCCHAGCGGGGILDFEQKISDCDRDTARKNVDQILGQKVFATGNRGAIATYRYTDERGRLIYEKLRYQPKTFKYRLEDESGSWIWAKGERSALYRLPELVTAANVIFCEGEKDADNVREALGKLNLNGKGYAVTTSGGSNDWRDEFAPYFAGREVVILPDNDTPGHAHAEVVAASISKYAAGVKIVNLPGLADKGDVSNYLETHTAQELLEEIRAQKTAWAQKAGVPHIHGDVPVGLQIKFLSSVKAEPQGWLWPMHIPDNQLLGLYGPSHTAKSIIATDWMARVTTGATWPDGSAGIAKPRNVLMLAPGEDALETVVKPRVVLAGGDPDRVGYIQAVGRFDDQGNIFEDMASLDQDIPAIDAALSEGDFGMLVIDPITNHLGAKKTNLENEVRPVLMRLKALAVKHKLPIIMIGHLNKRERGTAALDKVLGCRAFVGVPRTIYMTGTDNDTEERFRYELAQERGFGAKSWKYKTAMKEIVVDGADCKEIALSWEGQSDASGQDVVDALSREEKRTERDYAEQLVRYLQANGGTAAQEDCKKALGFPKLNWTRVRDKASVNSDVISGGAGKGGSTSVWKLNSENTASGKNPPSASISESTSKNIEGFNSVFSETYARIHSENTSENTREQSLYSRTSVLSANVSLGPQRPDQAPIPPPQSSLALIKPEYRPASFDCPDCVARFDTSAGWAQHSVEGCPKDPKPPDELARLLKSTRDELQCTFCRVAFETRGDRDRHQLYYCQGGGVRRRKRFRIKQ